MSKRRNIKPELETVFNSYESIDYNPEATRQRNIYKFAEDLGRCIGWIVRVIIFPVMLIWKLFKWTYGI